MIRFLAQVSCAVLLLALLHSVGTQAWHAYSRPAGSILAEARGAPQPPPAEAGQALPPINARAVSAYPETATRPVFFEGRRYPLVAKPAPPPIAAQAVPPRPLPRTDGFKLLGVMMQGDAGRALIEVPSQPLNWLGLGDKVQTWTITAIRAKSIDLNVDGQVLKLSLHDVFNSK